MGSATSWGLVWAAILFYLQATTRVLTPRRGGSAAGDAAVPPPPRDALHAAGAAAIPGLAPHAAAALADPGLIFIALNLFNNDDILPQFRRELLRLAAALGPSNVFVSVFENGSTDDTREHLATLQGELTAAGVAHRVTMADWGWRRFCGDIPDPALASECASADCELLRLCPEHIRIPVMAAIRNQALLPLLGEASVAAAEAAAAATRRSSESSEKEEVDSPAAEAALEAAARATLGMPASPSTTSPALSPALLAGRPGVTVLFLNDVLLRAVDIVELLATRGGGQSYDVACAMDFEGLKFYDTWVARDMAGATFSDWYPWVRDPAAGEAIAAGAPFRVFSCWNGAVAVRWSVMRRSGTLFRSWHEGEVRSPHAGANASQTYRGGTCTASECTLLSKDMWRVGAGRVWMNPRAQLAYKTKTLWFQRLLMRVANPGLLGWANRVTARHNALRSVRIDSPVGRPGGWSLAAEDAGSSGASGRDVAPPAWVACGLAGDDLYEDTSALVAHS